LNKLSIDKILSLLVKHYGRRQLVASHYPLDELIQTILSQNTSDTNSRRAFRALQKSFVNWENLLNADTGLIADFIKRGGLGHVKARRIQGALCEINNRRGKLDLDFLSEMSVPEARDWLLQIPGVGDKTASCVLLFALGKPALPVDTHIYRISKRLGLIGGKTSLKDAHKILEDMIAPEDIYEFHVLMIEHGRKTCIARNPRCTRCIIKKLCPSCKIFAGHPA
jgi:endonuclease-3